MDDAHIREIATFQWRGVRSAVQARMVGITASASTPRERSSGPRHCAAGIIHVPPPSGPGRLHAPSWVVIVDVTGRRSPISGL